MGKHKKDWRELSAKRYKPFPVNIRKLTPAVKKLALKAYLKSTNKNRVKEDILEMRLHPNDYANRANLSHLQRLGSMARNIPRRMKRNVRAINRLQKTRRETAYAHGTVQAGGQKYRYGGAQGMMKKDARMYDRARQRQWRFGGDIATDIGAGVLIAGGIGKGYKAYKKFRGMTHQRPQFRGYDVHADHGYTAVGIQPYNQPYYPDEDTYRAGAPRHARARIGVREDNLDEQTRRDLIEHITRIPSE